MASFYSRLFAKVYDSVLESAERSVLHFKRKKLLQDLTGDILEVGSGTGTNFKYYNSNTNIVAIEPSLPMLKKSVPKIGKEQNIELLNNGLYDFNSKGQKYDAIVCTLVLCTIPDLERAIKTIDNSLKEGGQLIILEHIHAKTKGKKIMFNLINPVWKIIGEGCNLNRTTDIVLKKLDFKPLWENHFSYKLDWYEGVFVKKA